MSNSYKKRPYTANTMASSQKESKRLGNRRLRRLNRLLERNLDADDIVYLVMDQVNNRYDMPYDGKRYQSLKWWLYRGSTPYIFFKKVLAK